jgi:hypothetical protein
MVRQAGKAASFREASDDLKELAGIAVGPSHLAKLAERVGDEWVAAREADVQAFRANTLRPACAEPPRVATVMVDGGRVQTRADDAGRGVTEPGWREVKVACCQTHGSATHATDPQPDPPAKFLDPVEAARLAAEVRAGRGGAPARSTPTAPAQPKPKPKPKPKRKRRRSRRRPRKLVRTVVASLTDSDTFGWHVAAEVQRRGLGRAQRKGYICDGQKYNWTLFELHLLPWGFVGILDVLHLLAYLYAAAQAVGGRGTARAWALYEHWLRLAWAGRVKDLLAGLGAGCADLGSAPADAADDDPRRVAAEALRYVTNNRERMDYATYRRLGLPISSAPVESVMKQVNRRMKGTEKFWVAGGAEALLQVRTAYLSEDGRADRLWSRPRPYAPAVGTGRLGSVA